MVDIRRAQNKLKLLTFSPLSTRRCGKTTPDMICILLATSFCVLNKINYLRKIL